MFIKPINNLFADNIVSNADNQRGTDIDLRNRDSHECENIRIVVEDFRDVNTIGFQDVDEHFGMTACSIQINLMHFYSNKLPITGLFE
jgi:hypothetical protein